MHIKIFIFITKYVGLKNKQFDFTDNIDFEVSINNADLGLSS